jgi:hypothetical protein
MVGDSGPVEGCAEPDLLATHFHLLALGEAVGVGRGQPRAADVGVERVGCVQVLFAEVSFLQRI